MELGISSIVESEKVIAYLESRFLLSQYKKAKQNILMGNIAGAQLKYRNPKQDGILYFRINKQFRAWCEKRDKVLIVFRIDNHQ